MEPPDNSSVGQMKEEEKCYFWNVSPVEQLKGTVSRDFLTPVFFIKHLLLVPLDTPRKDFEFFRIFEELFEFVIDSPVYSLPGSRDSPVVNTPGSQPKLVNKKTF
jgi:hypothetical protein